MWCRSLLRVVMITFAALGTANGVKAAPASGKVWRASWAASPVRPVKAGEGVPAEYVTPVLSNQTIVQTIRLSAGGDALRLRLSNEFGALPLHFGHVTVTLLDDKEQAVPATRRTVTFNGNEAFSIPAESPIISDPATMRLAPLARLQVALYVTDEAIECTCHADGETVTWLSPRGDYTTRDFQAQSTTDNRPFLTAVDVFGNPVGVIAALGDSITDGYLSGTGKNKRWPDRLAEWMQADRSLSSAAVINAGISGNRLLGPDPIAIFGVGALARLDRDILAMSGVTDLILLEGINDIGNEPATKATDLIAAYRQIIDRVHAHGIRVYLGTITPFEGSDYFSEAGERTRQAVNRWILSQREADGTIDFDAAVRDPLRFSRFKAELQSGDWLHPNAAGYAAMAQAVRF